MIVFPATFAGWRAFQLWQWMEGLCLSICLGLALCTQNQRLLKIVEDQRLHAFQCPEPSLLSGSILLFNAWHVFKMERSIDQLRISHLHFCLRPEGQSCSFAWSTSSPEVTSKWIMQAARDSSLFGIDDLDIYQSHCLWQVLDSSHGSEQGDHGAKMFQTMAQHGDNSEKQISDDWSSRDSLLVLVYPSLLQARMVMLLELTHWCYQS